jgi:hypothetical protein
MHIQMADKHRARHTRLWAAAKDFKLARSYADLLLKKGYFGQMSWLRRGAVSTTQQAITDAAIMAYMRGYVATSPKVPAEFLPLHEWLETRRNKLVAHTDAEFQSVRPWVAGDFATIVASFPEPYFTREQLVEMGALTRLHLASLTQQRRTILAKYVSPADAQTLSDMI